MNARAHAELRRRAIGFVILAVACLAAALVAPRAWAQSDPIRLVVGFPPGSNTDLLARVMAEAMALRLGRPVTVETRLGSAGSVATEAVVRATPDGATLGFSSPTLAITPHVARSPSYDTRTDLTWITIFAAAPVVVQTAPDYPPRDLRGLGDAMRAAPTARCGTPGAGSFLHLATVLVTGALGASCEVVHYADISRAMDDLQANRIQVYVNLLPAGLPMMRENRARILGIAARERHPLAPDIPTVSATVPGFEAVGWFTLIGPRALPEPILARLQQAAVETARDPAVANRLRALGAEPLGATGAELATLLRAADANWGEAARAARLTPN